MTSAKLELLNGLIDYAGLFPPAKLHLDEAVREYSTYRKQPTNWMLSRFIVPVTLLSDLEAYKDELFCKDKPYHFSFLCRSGIDHAEFLKNLQLDLGMVDEFIDSCRGCAVASAFEIKIPENVLELEGLASTIQLLHTAAELFSSYAPGGAGVFFEIPFTDNWRQSIDYTVRAVSAQRERFASMPAETVTPDFGLKIRCGGVTRDAFPSVEQLTIVIATARDAGIPLKATAGLHHPVRHYNNEYDVMMHGFLNVSLARILADVRSLNESELHEILEDTNHDHFTLTDNEISWKHHKLSIEEIKESRKRSFVSYGSCSFDEPREDLAAMNVIQFETGK